MRTIIFIFLSNIFFLLYAQKEGNKWLLGMDTGVNKQVVLEFQPDTILQTSQNGYATLDNTDANISHPLTGDFLFATNGSRIVGDSSVLYNGYNLSPCYYSQAIVTNGFRTPQSALILPLPNNPQKYYVLHETIAYGSGFAYADTLQYSIVDYSQNPNGAVTNKNTNLLKGQFTAGEITSCRHANGRDWWILYPYFRANKYYEYLLKPDGLHGPYEIKTNENFGSLDNAGYAVFSPDGKKYARCDAYLENKLYVYDFDRCSGNLTNGQWIDLMPYKSKYSIGSITFSPSSQYLYLNGENQLYQFNTNETPIPPPTLIANRDNFKDTVYGTLWETGFWMQELAPNGKIYISTGNGTKYLHTIHSPDSAGLACDFRQHDLKLIRTNVAAVPNMPDFNLGADSAYCDSTLSVHTGIKEEGIRKEVNVYPNPTKDKIHIALQNVREPLTFVLVNVLGQEEESYFIENEQGNSEISLVHLPKGMYFYLLKSEKGILAQGKIVKE